MVGTYKKDATTPNLLDGVTLDDAGTTAGTPWHAGWPADRGLDVTYQLTATSSGTGTATVRIEATDATDANGDADFTVGPVVTLGAFPTLSQTQDGDYQMTLLTPHRWVRASVTVTSTWDGTGSSLEPVPPHYHRTSLATAAPLTGSAV